MTTSLRFRIILMLVPLLALLGLMGSAAVAALYRLGGSIDAILRENYDSVLYMERLDEALERIDTSFQFAMAGREDLARPQYEENWQAYRDYLGREQKNITILPDESELVDRLVELTARYRRQGDAFYARPTAVPAWQKDYFGSGGLFDTFKEIKDIAGRILRLNQDHMEQSSRAAQLAARQSLVGFGIGLAASALLASVLAWHTTRSVLRPIRAVTQSALAIGRGNLDQVVPVLSHDELGLLADAFNAMVRQLRVYRQSDYTRLLRAQRTSQATIDSFPDPVLVVDEEGRVEMANPAAQRLLGVVPSPLASRGREVGGEAVAPHWQPPEALRQPLADAVRQQTPYVPDGFERALTFRVDGAEHFFLPRILPIRDPFGSSLGAAVLLEDVTRFRLLDQVKSDLVATASHELKTPLTGIRLALHLLLEETVGPLTPKQAELLVDARDNAEQLLAIVNRLLDLARLEQGREHLALRPAAPVDVLGAAAEAVRPRAADKNIDVEVEAAPNLPPVAVDGPRFGHALGNLLDNAVAQTDRGGRITLSAAAAGDGVVLSVADTGLGIAPEHLPHLFDKFFRIPGRGPDGGTGLGLAITREIVTAHGGTITCDSQQGTGTVFRIRLPRQGG
jgi:two-component system, NtrC family, sensor histidine kinase KinB